MRIGSRPLLLRMAPLGASMIRALGRSMRVSVHGAEQIDTLHRRGQPIIIVFWHGRQFLMPLAYRGRGASILISQHRDGELIQRVIERFGFQTVRGSSTRGGATAFRRLITLARAGVDLVITPDGPRGPREVVQAGVIHLARHTGLTIVPLAFGCSKKKSFPAGIGFRCRTPLAAGLSHGGNRSG